MERVNIMVGRFQPFTNGHLKCVNEAWIKESLKTVILCIDTKESDPKHPFTTDVLRKSFDNLIKEQRNILDVLYVKNANIVENAELCKMKGYVVASWTCGTDRIESYGKMTSKYSDSVAKDFKMIEIKRGDNDISATRIREALKRDDEKYFKANTPKAMHSLYTKLKNIIKKVL